MTQTNGNAPVLVIGGTGKTGRRVLERLEARGVPTRLGSRRGDPPFDWNDQDTWRAALAGARAAYVTYQPDLAVPGAVEAVAELAAVALEQGVRRLVLLSGRGEAEAQRAEDALRASGAEWTILRASWFAQNFSESFFLDPLRAGELELPVGDVGEPFVDVDDIADVAVAALTEPGHEGRLYELTGPRLLTFADAVREIAAAAGRAIDFRTVPADAYQRGLAAHGVPAEITSLLMFLFTEVLDGRNARIGDGVQQALGRAPRDFGAYAATAAATGVWAA